MALLLRQRANRAHERRVRRQPQLGVNVQRRLGLHEADIDPFVNRDDAGRVDAVADEHLVDRLGGGNEPIDLMVLPPRKCMLFEMKGHAPRRHERRAERGGAERQRKRREGDRMRVVGMNDLGVELSDDARQLPAGVKVDFGTRSQADKVVSFGRTPRKLSLRMSDEYRPVTVLAKTEYGQQHLTLAAAPRTRCVEVKGEHSRKSKVE